MTTTQYIAYQAAVQSFLTRNRVLPGCHGPVNSDFEPFFSWRPCECCGSRLGGNREEWQFAHGDNFASSSNFEAEICTDCIHYLSSGQLDDMTMMEMSNNGQRQ